MAYSKAKTAKKGTVQGVSVFLAGLIAHYIPGADGLGEAGLIAGISAVVASIINYFKHK